MMSFSESNACPTHLPRTLTGSALETCELCWGWHFHQDIRLVPRGHPVHGFLSTQFSLPWFSSKDPFLLERTSF